MVSLELFSLTVSFDIISQSQSTRNLMTLESVKHKKKFICAFALLSIITNKNKNKYFVFTHAASRSDKNSLKHEHETKNV